MPKQKAPKGAASADASSSISDPRFTNFATDPRYRLPSKKSTKTKLDKRFSRMLEDDDFTNTATVDRYGRKVDNVKKKKALERLYTADDEEKVVGSDESEEEKSASEDEAAEAELKASYDPARGGGFSSSEDEDEDEDEEDGGVEIDEAEFPDMQAEAAAAAVEMGEVTSRFAVVNLDWDNIKATDLMAVFSSFVPTGGRILKVSIYPSEFGKERMQREELEGPPKEIFTSKPESEDGIFSADESEDSASDDEEEIKKDLQKGDDGQEFDGAALRQYQLERLRYYYAVVLCSDTSTAQKIYENTDGTEYLSSANFFDLRFIPDGTEFDDAPRDECDAVPAGYRPLEFVTDALQHSKVKLTWDMAPEEASRKDAINRAFSGSRTELNENDLRAYLGSDSEDSEPEAEPSAFETEENEPTAAPLSKKELQRQKMREALGLTSEPTTKSKKSASSGPVGDMEITFTAGLSTSSDPNAKSSVFTNDPAVASETTAERYIRLEKERKAKRKERAKAKRDGTLPVVGVDADTAAAPTGQDDADAAPVEEDLGFNDPFFATDEISHELASKKEKSLRKEERLAKRAAKDAERAAKATQRAELELLMQEDPTAAEAVTSNNNLDHFDMNEIARAEKRSRKRKGKLASSSQVPTTESKRGGLQEGFEMDVADDRFSKVFSSHEFAIDPSNPKFKGTEGMKKLLEEGRKKMKKRGLEEDDDGEQEEEEVGVKRKRSRKNKDKDAGGEGEGEDLSNLVASLKKKSRV